MMIAACGFAVFREDKYCETASEYAGETWSFT
jgi:hypothetical protein